MRPIIMTTAAMVFGMFPLALALDEGGELQAPMGRAIIGGVITSTLLTLVVVPVIYAYIEQWVGFFKHRLDAQLARRDHRRGADRPGRRRADDRAACRWPASRGVMAVAIGAERVGLRVVREGQRLPARLGRDGRCWACWAS